MSNSSLLPIRQNLSRLNPDFNLRAEWHDYTSKCVYMITFLIETQAPVLSRIKGSLTPKGVLAYTDLSPVGELVNRHIKTLDSHFRHVSAIRYALMPDHVHILLNVKEKASIHLGEIVRALKSECTRSYTQAFPSSFIATQGIGLFKPGFNDKICMRPGQYEGYKRYIEENPKRHFIRVNCPEFFCTWRNVLIDGREVALYGNFELLRYPLKSVVRFSRKYSAARWAEVQEEWNRTIREQGVLVSPFIHPNEREAKREGIARGARIIKVVDNGFPQRFKPQGDEIEACAEGRLLLIAPPVYDFRRSHVTRNICMEMNAFAEKIAALDFNTRLHLTNGKTELAARIKAAGI